MSGKLFHAPFIQHHPGFELKGIVERIKNESKEKYPGTKVYRSVEELINDNEIQLVIVNTPAYTHYEYAKAAIEAGKHVIVEKPMVPSVKEAERLVQLAKDHKVLLNVYQNRRYDGDYRAVQGIIETKILGDLKEIEIKYDRYRPGLSGKAHKEGGFPGSGIFYDLGAHLIDQALQFFGWPDSLFADIWTIRENTEADDYFELLLIYKKLRVRLKSSVLVREALPAYVLHGTMGSFLQKRSDLQEQQLLAGVIPSLEPWCKSPGTSDGILHTEINGEVIRKQTHSSPGNYMGYFQDIYSALTQNTPGPVPGEDGIKIIKIIEAGLQSVAEKRVVFL